MLVCLFCLVSFRFAALCFCLLHFCFLLVAFVFLRGLLAGRPLTAMFLFCFVFRFFVVLLICFVFCDLLFAIFSFVSCTGDVLGR